MIFGKSASKKTGQTAVDTQDEPLPATLTFVLVMGATFAVLWFVFFILMKDRW